MGPKEGWSAMEVIDDGGCGAVGGNGVVLVAVVVLFLRLEYSE